MAPHGLARPAGHAANPDMCLPDGLAACATAATAEAAACALSSHAGYLRSWGLLHMQCD